MRFKTFISGFLIICAAGAASVSVAEDKPPIVQAPAAQEKPPAVQAPVDPEVKRLAQGLIEETLKASHAAEIFADLRHTLSEVYIPVMREMVQGGYPGAPEVDIATASQLAKMLTFMDYARKAGDDLDVALSENRSAMISDAAEQMARTANASEITDVRNILQLPAARKAFDAIYSVSKLVTGFSYQDSRKFSEFSAWANNLTLDLSQALPGAEGPRAVPSKHKVVKAQAFMDDLLQMSHLDEMIADAKRFLREVWAETAPMSEEEREKLIDEIDQFEFNYNMQKAVVIAIAPSVVAAALSDEQLDTLHGYLRAPSFAKAFDLCRDSVKAATALTKEDILEAKKSFEDLDKKSKLRERSKEEQDKAQSEWSALIDKWKERLKGRISPETQRGLEQSLSDLKIGDSPI